MMTNFRPIATVEQAVAYDPSKPETATPSRIVNVIIEVCPHVAGTNARSLGEHLGLSEQVFNGAVLFDTGLTLLEFLEQWRVGMIHRLNTGGKHEKGVALARQLGFADRSSLTRFLRRNNLKLNK